jgi:hypothetical protein
MKNFEGFASTFLAFVIGLLGAVLLSSWTVCEQDDRYCAFTGEQSK